MIRLAARQHGVVTRAQLRGAGFTNRAIDRRLESGHLHRVHRGVYLVGHVVMPEHAREMSAVLAVGPNAVLSHQSAAWLWQLHPSRPASVDVTVSGRNAGHKPGIRIHRVSALGPGETRTCQRIPTTTPARTLIDLACEVSARELEQAVAQAQTRGLTSRGNLLALLARHPGRRGTVALRALLNRGSAAVLTRSEAEERFLALVRKAQLPVPDVNVGLAGYEVDFLWREERLIVEVDGFAFHSSRAAFERDRLRDADLQAQGFRIIRVTWRQIVDHPEAMLVRITKTLSGPAR
jgi:very-short-patch-repair endonuclease